LFNASTYKLARIYTYLVNLDKKDKNGSLYRIRNGKSYYVSGKEDLDVIFSSFISFKNVADNKVIKDLVSKIVEELFQRGQNAFADNNEKVFTIFRVICIIVFLPLVSSLLVIFQITLVLIFN
jgi:hypothetical protein